MKYSVKRRVNLELSRVIALFEDRDGMFEWQQGLQSFEHISGELGSVGAKSALSYKMGKREIDMVETIVVYEFPHLFSATYEPKGFGTLSRTILPKMAMGRSLGGLIPSLNVVGFYGLWRGSCPACLRNKPRNLWMISSHGPRASRKLRPGLRIYGKMKQRGAPKLRTRFHSRMMRRRLDFRW